MDVFETFKGGKLVARGAVTLDVSLEGVTVRADIVEVEVFEGTRDEGHVFDGFEAPAPAPPVALQLTQAGRNLLDELDEEDGS